MKTGCQRSKRNGNYWDRRGNELLVSRLGSGSVDGFVPEWVRYGESECRAMGETAKEERRKERSGRQINRNETSLKHDEMRKRAYKASPPPSVAPVLVGAAWLSVGLRRIEERRTEGKE